MNDYDPNNMSRSNRPKNKKIEPKFARTSDSKSENKGLRVALIVLGLVILSAFPVYGFFSNHKGSTPQTVSSSSQHKSSTKKSSSSTSTSSETTSSDSSVSSASQSEASSSSESTTDDETAASSSSSASSSATTTAVLGTSQTLYNFAVTHGLTTDQVIALNPGLTVDNYTQYAGTVLNIQ
ncbi:peptidoglycan-binding protein LysM [Leuconostoc falkenbergense]|jgi:LysM repeat protein|uniref:Peptidoglycan-binding protein LysM n=1 Tax=Leuconostoc falkenbergense TaxID=2766470 RepID=A0A9X3EA70_9LACO|nr:MULTISPECIES: peptidoglycan-binding protein LysM [Leuconostoc]RDG19502.1 peptidoglycan-binding protein LysM [Leuconostoc pseudomesenteroides]MCT4390772.1 peptidoglycan-binding protein LysM [Leuconostoc falkenbergense]MCT4410648.1 peptidoglycan-binding protein LysM [Leuconostoc falkenbergense]MCX7579252.1 peptidoglycan-binding protein LysM [Leuconostoc falkenbergense]MDM7647077.1 peptidoglycan-binding protein LysM [Leuconostoc falkenbergense]